MRNSQGLKAPSGDTLEAEAKAWVEAMLQRPIFADVTFHEGLKDGTVLCELANTIKTSICPPPSMGKLPFHKMENISAYLRACTVLGVPTHELYQTVDLFEAKNLKAVAINLHALGRLVQQMPGFDGPTLGVKMSAAAAAKPAVKRASTKSGYMWPVEQGELSMLALLAEAAAAAKKMARIKQTVALKAAREAEEKTASLQAADAEYTRALAEDPQHAAAVKHLKEAAAAEAAKASEQAQSAQEEAAQAEAAAQVAVAAYDAEAKLATSSAEGVVSIDDGFAQDDPFGPDDPLFATPPVGFGSAAEEPAPLVPPAPPVPPAPAAPPVAAAPSANVAPPPIPPAAPPASAVAPPPVPPATTNAAPVPHVDDGLKAQLQAVEAERDALSTRCESLAAELRESRLREESLRKMISLALDEAIPPATCVEAASFTHARA